MSDKLKGLHNHEERDLSVRVPSESTISPTRYAMNTYPILRFFNYRHLPLPLQPTSKKFSELAFGMVIGADGFNQEKEAGLRKLLEAKDCFVRSELSNE